MLRGVFVTGTGTGVGKTVASAALLHRYRLVPVSQSDSPPTTIRYWKPIQTGVAQDDDTAEVRRLGTCRHHEVFDRGVRLPEALSPHLAARLNNQSIEIDAVLNLVTAEPASDRWIVEGAGGVLVPVNDSELIVDMMTRLRLPVVVVARTTLGTINHTLLTIEALRTRSLEVAGVLMVGERNQDNRDAIASYGRVPILGEMPMLDPLTAELLKRWSTAELDPAGLLAAHLR